ncbi:MAG TPA: Hsp70 family protein, partial [Terriglobia bacterium]|nr:Hsp70 family protein [Terriglobia bacterium]
DLEKIRTCVDRLLQTTGITSRDVDRVFLTGGSSLVPAVRRIFEDQFDAGRISGGNEFTSVAKGLALRALSEAQN